MQILKGTTICHFLNSKCSMFSLLFLQYSYGEVMFEFERKVSVFNGILRFTSRM